MVLTCCRYEYAFEKEIFSDFINEKEKIKLRNKKYQS